MRRLVGWGAFVLGVAALFPLQSAIDATRAKRPSSLLYMPDRRLMKVVSCGYGPLLADLVWVQSINYVIEEFQGGSTHIAHLYDLFDTLTELDPNFVDAYVTGATFLCSLAQEPEIALQLLEKGQGKLLDDLDPVVEDPAHPGRVAKDHPDRWRILLEYVSTHLVTLAGFSSTDTERQQEIRKGGRLLEFGGRRYPGGGFDWSVGKTLAKAPPRLGRHGKTAGAEHSSTRDWLLAQKLVWGQKVYFSGEGSPLRRLAERRVKEIEASWNLVDLDEDLNVFRAGEPLGVTPPGIKLLPGLRPRTPGDPFPREEPRDPLGVGYFIIQPETVLSRDDISRIEAELQGAVLDFFEKTGRFPLSLEDVEAARPLGVRPLPGLPLGVDAYLNARTRMGFVIGKVIAPGVDAAMLERVVSRRAASFRSRIDRWPASLNELQEDLDRSKLPRIVIPRWVTLAYDPSTGECQAYGHAP